MLLSNCMSLSACDAPHTACQRHEVMRRALWLQVETLAEQVADLQDQADAREDAHSERVEALQATIERLSGEAESAAEARTGELEAKCAALEEQASMLTVTDMRSHSQCGKREALTGDVHAAIADACGLDLSPVLQVADMDSANIELEDANTQLEASANAAEQRCAALEQEVQKLHSAQSTLKVCIESMFASGLRASTSVPAP